MTYPLITITATEFNAAHAVAGSNKQFTTNQLLALGMMLEKTGKLAETINDTIRGAGQEDQPSIGELDLVRTQVIYLQQHMTVWLAALNKVLGPDAGKGKALSQARQ